jgi:porin
MDLRCGAGAQEGAAAERPDAREILEQATSPKHPLIPTPGIDRALAPWYALKQRLHQDHGLWFVVNYSALYQRATASKTGIGYAAGGVFDTYGVWVPFARGTGWEGLLGFRIADQHPYGRSVPPSRFGAELGSSWGTALAFDRRELVPIELWWEQHLFQDALRIRVGKLDPYTIFDPLSLSHPFEGFMSHPLTLNSAIAWSGSGAGALVRFNMGEGFYVHGGIFDANGNQRDLDTFFERKEYLTMAQLGWNPSFAFGKGDYRLMLWKADKRTIAGVAEGSGVAIIAEQEVGNLMPFLRYGNATGGATFLKNMVAAGLGFRKIFGRQSDVLALGAIWGEPLFPGLRTQYGLEAYYRLQVTNEFALTPDVQLIFNPANNPNVDCIAVFSLRARLSL